MAKGKKGWDEYVKKQSNPGTHRKHTPIVSEKQRRFFGAEYSRGKKGLKKETGMSQVELKRHLKESKGKKLPLKKKRKKR